MRTAIFLLLALALLLTGCPASDPAIPTSQEAKSPVTESAMANEAPVDPNATTLEVTDIPSSLSEPRLDENAEVRHAAAFEGDVSLEGSGVTGGGRESNPFLVSIPASAGDLVQVHLRGTLESGGVGTLTAQVSVPGYSTIVSIPATDAWVYKAFYMPSSGMLEIRLFNGATYNGPLNIDAASMSYYAKGIPTPFSGEPNADNDPATLTDRSLASPIELEIPASRGLLQTAGGPTDTEEWYGLKKGYVDPELKVTFDTYGHRYGAWQYEITFYDSTGGQIGLKTIFRAPASAKLFSLSGLSLDIYVYMHVIAKPLASAFTTNAAYAIHNVATIAPLAIRPIPDSQSPPFTQRTFSAAVGGNPSADAVWYWGFGGGATCTSSCGKVTPSVMTGAPGKYTGLVLIIDGTRVSKAIHFTYELTCYRWPFYYSSWIGPNDYPGVVWLEPATSGTLISSGGKPYAITEQGAGDVRSTNLWHRLGGVNQQLARQLATTPHAGRVYLAFIDYYTNHLMMWVSSDAVPDQKSDWKLVTIDERTVVDKPIAMASSGNRLGVLYTTGAGGNELRLAYSKTQLADRQLDWGTGIVQSEFVPSMHALTANAGRWVTAQRVPGSAQILITVARDLAPYSDSHWNTHPLVASSLDDTSANISLISAGGLLTAIYAVPVSTWYDFRVARSTVAVPQTANDWITSSIIPGNTLSYDVQPGEPYHVLTLVEGSYVVGFQLRSSSDVGLWRSCDLAPRGATDWSRAKLADVNPGGEYPQNLLGLTSPGDGSMYALYHDFSFNGGEVMRLHKLSLDLW